MAGSFGYELDLNLLSDGEKEEVKEQIKTFKKYYNLTHEGEYYRLTNPMENRLYAAWSLYLRIRARLWYTACRSWHSQAARPSTSR